MGAVGIRFKKISWILDADVRGYFDAISHKWMANVYLHYVLDLWVHWWRQRYARGDVIIVRWADDFVVGFQYEADGRRFLEQLRDRFRKFSLELHPDKTRLIRFGRFARRDSRRFDGRSKAHDSRQRIHRESAERRLHLRHQSGVGVTGVLAAMVWADAVFDWLE